MSKPLKISPSFQRRPSDNCHLNRAAVKHSDSLEDLSGNPECHKSHHRAELVHPLIGYSSKPLHKPKYSVRPIPGFNPPPPSLVGRSQNIGPVYNRTCLLKIFSYLTPVDLSRCALVCHFWFNISSDPSLWKQIDVSGKSLTRPVLINIVRKQPEVLILNWTGIGKQQLAWMIVRLPQLKELSLQGCLWIAVLALRTCNCPPLTVLDLSFVAGLNDASLRELLSPPPDSRPGLIDKASRLRHLQKLMLAGCDLSDLSLQYIAQNLPNLAMLDISSCPRLTDAGVAQLAIPPAPTITTLIWLNLAGCRLLTETSLEHLSYCKSLEQVDFSHISNIPSKAINKFLASRVQLTRGRKKKKGELLAAFKRNDIGKVLQMTHHLPDLAKFNIPFIMNTTVGDVNNPIKLSPLQSAIHHGNYHVCELLIEDGVSLEEEDPLTMALRHEQSDIAELLIKRGADVSTMFSGGTYPLYWAIVRNNPPRIVEQIIVAGFPVNGIVLENNLLRAIHVAAHENNIEAAKVLIRHSVDLNVITGYRDEKSRTKNLNFLETALNIAVKKNFPGMVKLLVESGANLENRNASMCPLFWAVKLEHLNMVEVLINLGVDIQEGWVENNILPPLQFAIGCLSVDIAILLINKGARTTAEHRVSKETALHVIATHVGFEFPEEKLKRLQVKIAKSLIEKGANVNAKDCLGRTPLDGAIVSENTELCKLFLREGAQVSGSGWLREDGLLSNRFEFIACMSAFKCPDLIKLCLERGGDYDFRDRHGLTPYHRALVKHNPAMVKVFWQHFCPHDQPELQPGKMKSMLWYSPDKEDKKILEIQADFLDGIENNKLALVESALERGAEVRGCSMKIPSTLHYLATSENQKIAKILLDRGVPVNQINKKGETPLYIAVARKNLHCVQVFLQSGACYNYHTAKLKKTPLKALVKKHKEIHYLFKKIYHSFRLVKQGNKKVVTFLQKLIETGDLDTVSIVMNCVNSKGQSLVELALCLGYSEISIELLMLRLENIHL